MAAVYDAIERNKKPAGALEIPENYHFREQNYGSSIWRNRKK